MNVVCQEYCTLDRHFDGLSNILTDLKESIRQ
jgi:hypothetical protein